MESMSKRIEALERAMGCGANCRILWLEPGESADSKLKRDQDETGFTGKYIVVTWGRDDEADARAAS